MKTYQIITTTSERFTIIADSLTEACKEVRESGYYVAKVYQVAQWLYRYDLRVVPFLLGYAKREYTKLIYQVSSTERSDVGLTLQVS